MPAAEGARMGIACMYGGAVAGGETGGILVFSGPVNLAGSEVVRLGAAGELAMCAGSEVL